MGRYCNVDAYADSNNGSEEVAAQPTGSVSTGSNTPVDLEQDAVHVVINALTPTNSPIISSQDPQVPVTNISDELSLEYSLTGPGHVFVGDWEGFGNVNVFNTEPESSASASVNNVNVGPPVHSRDAVTFVKTDDEDVMPLYDDDLPVHDRQPLSFQDFYGTEDFGQWYEEALRTGVFDSISFNIPVPSPSIGCNPTWSFGSGNPHLLRQPSPTIVKRRDESSDDHPDAEAIFDVERPYVTPTQDTYRPNAIVTSFVPNSTDLNDMGLLAAQEEDEDDVAEEDVASSDDEDEDCLEPENIVRHYWYRNDIEYT
jgi:hypothetical protein